MGRKKTEDRMLPRTDGEFDELKIYGSTTGTYGSLQPTA
jgi:hypothetical protein